MKQEYFLHVNSSDKNTPEYYKLQLTKKIILNLSFFVNSISSRRSKATQNYSPKYFVQKC